MIVIKNPKPLIFVHNKRTAGTSITKWLQYNFDAIKVSGKHQTLKHSRSDMFTFCVIRNPWDCAVSTHHYHLRKINEKENRLKNGRGTRKINFEKLKKWREITDIPFNEWLKNNLNCLPKPYNKKIKHIEYKLRFENLENDFKIVQQYLNCYRPLEKRNTSKHKNYRSYYNDESKEIISNLYKEDILQFGFEF